MACVAGKVIGEIYDSLVESDARMEVMIDFAPEGSIKADLQKALDHIGRAMGYIESAMDGHDHTHACAASAA